MLALSYAADLLGTGKFVPKYGSHPGGFELTTPIAKDAQNPITGDNGTQFPYPVAPIWPQGWTPAVAPTATDIVLKRGPWAESIFPASPLEALIPDTPFDKFLPEVLAYWKRGNPNYKLGMNNVIFTYHAKRNTYAISFAGTENALGGLEDLTCVLVSARGDIDVPMPILGQLYPNAKSLHYRSTANYVSNPAYWDRPALEGQPPVITPRMHFGFRLATEAFTVKARDGEGLIPRILQAGKGKKEINLLVTGHSLGGGIAQAFAAWINADGAKHFPFKINLKLYSFAAPKSFNDAAGYNFDAELSRRGMAYRVANNLDSVPQLGFTLETIASLQNPQMVMAVASLIGGAAAKWAKKHHVPMPDHEGPVAESALAIAEFLSRDLSMNYAHVGNPIPVISDYPVVYPGTPGQPYPAYLYPNGMSKAANQPEGTTPWEWWQHWPWVYYQFMKA